VQTNVQILGWETQGLRCPDHKISFTDRAGKVYPITLLQMPNGTGKTTTLELLRAALSGAAEEQWDGDKVRSLKKRGNKSGRGMFRVVLSYNSQRLTITIDFDFDDGSLKYATTLPTGMRSGFHPPRELKKFLRPEFVRFFVFDGELAEQLLSREYTDAQTVIEDLFQLRLFSSLTNQVNAYWQRQIDGRGATEDRGLSRRRNKVATLQARIKLLKRERATVQKQYEKAETELREKDAAFRLALSQQSDLREKLRRSESDYMAAGAAVRESSQSLLGHMRSPQSVSVVFAKQMIALKANLDRVKLPESTAREFFEELAEEEHCVCGRELDDVTRRVIRERASQYLGSDDVSLLNAIKGDIADFIGPRPEAHEAALKDELARLVSNCRAEQEARTARDEIQNEGVTNDPALEKARSEIEELQELLVNLRAELERFEDSTETAGDDETYGIRVLEKRLKDAENKLAEVTHTLTLKQKRDVLMRLLERAQEKARIGISTEICVDANQRVAELMPNNAIRIDQVDRCLRLQEQEGGSVGETLSVAYAFLATLFNRTEHKLPFIVDSPANPIDLRVRAKVAELIPRLTGQFIAFTISSERPGFLPALERAAKGKIQYTTLFRKGATDLDQAARDSGQAEETADGFCIAGHKFFNQFHVDSEGQNAV
jgi:DNA sulfur modification protein DndD